MSRKEKIMKKNTKGTRQMITKEYISIFQIHKDSHLHEVYGLFYFREHLFCINTNATNNIILWIDSTKLKNCIEENFFSSIQKGEES